MLPELLPAAAVIVFVMAILLLRMVLRLRAEQPAELVLRVETAGAEPLRFAGGAKADLVAAIAVRAPAGSEMGVDEARVRGALDEVCEGMALPTDSSAFSESLATELSRILSREVHAVVERLIVRG